MRLLASVSWDLYRAGFSFRFKGFHGLAQLVQGGVDLALCFGQLLAGVVHGVSFLLGDAGYIWPFQTRARMSFKTRSASVVLQPYSACSWVSISRSWGA